MNKIQKTKQILKDIEYVVEHSYLDNIANKYNCSGTSLLHMIKDVFNENIIIHDLSVRISFNA